MRRPTLAIAAAGASALLLLSACGSDSSSSGDAATSPSASPPTSSMSESPSPMMSASGNESGGNAALGNFPDVPGFTYTELPSAALKQFQSTVKGTPQIEDFQGRLVAKEGSSTPVGFVMQIAISPDAANAPGFEDGFLPGFAGGLAGVSAKPTYKTINGTKVVVVDTPSAQATAYAWLANNIATVLVFQDGADAETFANAALS
jgi:hypothetical protein